MHSTNQNWKEPSYEWRRIVSEDYNRKWISKHSLSGWENTELTELGLDSQDISDSEPFRVVWLRNIDRLIDLLPIEFNPENFTLIDAGCGAGVSTLYFYDFYPFKYFLGFDFSEDLINTAKANLLTFNSKSKPVKKIDFIQSDARLFCIPDTPCFIFMYNPFGFNTAKIFFDNNLRKLQQNGAILAISYDPWINQLLELKIHRTHIRDAFNNLSLIVI
jgi:SAM-dependent methyltransferase